MPETPTPLDGSTLLRVSDGVLKRSAGNETVLLDLESEEFFGLDSVGARVFSLLEEPRTLDEVIDTIHTEYAVEREVAAVDLAALVSDLLDRHLLVAG